MTVFGSDKARGCFVVFRMNASEGRGARLDLPSGSLPEEDYAYPLTVVGFTMNQQENFSLVKCFGDHVYTYAFGHDPAASTMQIEFVGMLRAGVTKVLMQSGGGGSGGGISKLLTDLPSKYERGRLYKSLAYSNFLVGGAVFKGFLVGMSSNTMSPEHSLQSFTMTLQLVEVQGT